MKKDDIITKLKAAGVEIPEGATVAQLVELAASKNIDLTEPAVGSGSTDPVPATTDSAAGSGSTDQVPPASDPGEPEELVIKSPFDVAAEREIAAMKPSETPRGISDAAIGEKVRAGLTRDQAIEVLKAQAEHDAAQAADEKTKGKGNKA